MAQTIKLKRSSVAGNIPSTSDLALGEVAINTADGKMYIKKSVDGTDSIIDLSDSPQDAILQEYQFTASANQTTFSGVDDNNDTLYYTAGAAQIFLNGILLDSGVDYTATNGTSIVLAETVDANDYLQVFAFKQKISGGSVTVNTFTGNGSTTAFTLSVNPGDENNTRVFIDGVYQSKSNYSVSATTLTFTTAPPTGTAIEVESGNRDVALDTTTNLDFPDNVKMRLGTSQDLQLYHDGSHSYIKDNGTGNLYLGGSGAISFNSSDFGETYAIMNDDGAVVLYHNNVAKLSTDAQGINVTGGIDVADITATGNVTLNSDNGTAYFGAGADLRIYHDGSNSYIKNITSQLYVLADYFNVKNAANSKFAIRTFPSDAVKLYFNNDEKLATNNTGVTVTGNIANTSGDLTLDVAGNIVLDADGGGVYFKDAGVNIGFLQNSGANDFRLVAGQQDKDIVFMGNDGGSSITALTLDMSDAGTAIFNHDAKFPDNAYIKMGAGSDLSLNSDGTNGRIFADNGNLTLDVAGDIILDAAGGEVRFSDGSQQEFVIDMNDASTKTVLRTLVSNSDLVFEGNDGGVGFAALTLDMSEAGDAFFNADVRISDNRMVRLGNGQDLRLYHDGAHSYIVNTYASGALKLKSDDFRVENTAGRNQLKTGVSGAVQLFYDTGSATSVKLATTSGGVAVTGSVTSTGLTATGANTSAATYATFQRSDTAVSARIRYDGSTTTFFGTSTNHPLAFETNGTEAMRIDSSGNVGLGVTPNANWSSSYRAIDAFGGATFQFEANSTRQGQNFYGYPWKYKATRTATSIAHTAGGDISFQVAPSGTADSAITWSQAMLIKNSGKVGIGTSSPNLKLHVEENADAWVGEFKNVRSAGGYGLRVDMTAGSSATDTRYALAVYTPGNSGFFIRNNGNIGMGQTAPAHLLDILKTGTGDATINIKSTTGGDPNIIFNSAAANRSGLLKFQDNGTNVGRIEYVHNGDRIDFQAGSATGATMSVKNGKVGIGTISPQKKFHVEHTAGASEGILISGASDTAGHTAGILLRAEGGEADSALRAKAGIFLERTATYGIGKLHIANRHNSDNVSATISDANITIYDDKVGIGTTSPSNMLSVNGVITSGNFTASGISGSIGDANTAELGPGYLVLARDDTADASQIRFGKNGAVHSYLETRTNGLGFITNVGNFAFEGGNVGIGTTSPTAKLHVYDAGGNDPSFRVQRGLDGGRIQFVYASNTTTGLGEIGQTYYGTGRTRIWMGANLESFSTGHSGPAQQDSSYGSWFSTWDSYADEFTVNRIASGTTTEMLTLNYLGRLGVGTTNPSYLVHAQNSTATGQSVVATSGNGQFIMAIGSQNSPGVAQEAFVGTLSDTRFKIKVNNTVKGSWTDNGLAIGTQSSAYTNLDVAGQIAMSIGNAHAVFSSDTSGKIFIKANENCVNAATAIHMQMPIISGSGSLEDKLVINHSDITAYEHFLPSSDNIYDLGTAAKRWRNIYTGDLHLSNETQKKGNDVDGTKGNWTVQEGEENLYLINNKTGKKYKFALEEIE